MLFYVFFIVYKSYTCIINQHVFFISYYYMKIVHYKTVWILPLPLLQSSDKMVYPQQRCFVGNVMNDHQISLICTDVLMGIITTISKAREITRPAWVICVRNRTHAFGHWTALDLIATSCAIMNNVHAAPKITDDDCTIYDSFNTIHEIINFSWIFLNIVTVNSFHKVLSWHEW